MLLRAVGVDSPGEEETNDTERDLPNQVGLTRSYWYGDYGR